MNRRLAAAAALCVLGAIVLALGASALPYGQLPPQAGLLRLSMSIAGARLEPCRELTPEEIARLAANMRAAQACPRARADIRVLLWINADLAIDAIVSPRGWARDGDATLYRRIVLPSGRYRLRVAVNEDARQAAFRHDAEFTRDLRPGQVLTVDFDHERAGVIVR